MWRFFLSRFDEKKFLEYSDYFGNIIKMMNDNIRLFIVTGIRKMGGNIIQTTLHLYNVGSDYKSDVIYFLQPHVCYFNLM